MEKEHDAHEEELDTNEWKRVFSQLIEQIGLLSDGGNSVEDIRKKRERGWFDLLQKK